MANFEDFSPELIQLIDQNIETLNIQYEQDLLSYQSFMEKIEKMLNIKAKIEQFEKKAKVYQENADTTIGEKS